MTVNNGGNLSIEYFISYLKLVMEARSYSLEEAKNFMFNNYFKNNNDTYGKESHIKFLQAIERLREGN